MSDDTIQPGFFRFFRALFYGFCRLMFRLEVHGAEHIPASGGCLMASNHASYMDPLLVGSAIRHRAVRFMARGTLFRFKPFGWFLRKMGTVPIDRDRGDLSALRKGVRLLKSGRLLCLFPEGTRTMDGRLQEAKGGIGLLIAKASVPVIPVYIDGSYRAFPRGAILIRPKKVNVYYGKPIMPDELPELRDGKPDYARIGQLVMSRIAALKPPQPR